ncbi:MAG: hypothetical protein M1374_03620 [Firmicutes bacterium]|jgi:hypothetical protein|nr:hypothetical protein [Bacillota bacterium]
MGWSEDLKERLQSGMKSLEPNIQAGKDFMEHLLTDIQKEADLGREKVSEAKLDLEELAQNMGAKAKLTGERFEEMIRQEVQRQINSYIRHQRELLSQTVVTYASRVQGIISGVARQVLASPTGANKEASPPPTPEEEHKPKASKSPANKVTSKATPTKSRAKKALPDPESKTRHKNT